MGNISISLFAESRKKNAHSLEWASSYRYFYLGAPGQIRTAGPLFRRQMLYPLSYGCKYDLSLEVPVSTNVRIVAHVSSPNPFKKGR